MIVSGQSRKGVTAVLSNISERVDGFLQLLA